MWVIIKCITEYAFPCVFAYSAQQGSHKYITFLSSVPTYRAMYIINDWYSTLVAAEHYNHNVLSSTVLPYRE